MVCLISSVSQFINRFHEIIICYKLTIRLIVPLIYIGLYKQATVGRDRPARPGMLNIDGRMKWDAWAAEEKLSKEEARQAYVDLAKELVGKPVEDILA